MIDVTNLHAENINDKPSTFDFGHGFDERWADILPDLDGWSFEQCTQWLDDQGHGSEYDTDLDGIREQVLDVMVENQDYAPMMNYIYPIHLDTDKQTAQAILDNLPVVLVNIKDDPEDRYSGWTAYLALSGGGMDLTWEIAEAYIRLGQLPPTHFCNPPAMSGRGKSEHDKHIIRACLASLERAMNWLNRDRNTLITTYQVNEA